jgi:aminopeptidase-like protein
MGYSIPVDQWLELVELVQHLYSLPDQPNAIPYITSYYKERWGFCLSHEQREQLRPGRYHAVIDSELKGGSLTYGEIIIPGETKQEIFLSTYLCHPSMANNELSGPVVTAFLAKWLLELPKRKYTYRIVFIPETIGSITYLSRNLTVMKENIIAGFNISCVGDERAYSYISPRYNDTLVERVVFHIMSYKHPDFIKYSYLDRGSDERQYCSPGVHLPVVSISRSKYGTYPEYHTSLDDLTMVTPKGLAGSYEFMQECIIALEKNEKYIGTCLCEPQLGKRGLYPNLSTKSSANLVRNMMNFMAYADGNYDLLDISNLIYVCIDELYSIVDKLSENGLIRKI